MWGCRYTKRGEDIHTWDAFVYAWTTSRKWCKEQETVIASGIMNRGWGWMGPGEVAVESLSCVWLCAIPWTVAHLAPLSTHAFHVHGILQARILVWVATPFSRGSSWSRDQTCISCIAGRFFTNAATLGSSLMLNIARKLGQLLSVFVLEWGSPTSFYSSSWFHRLGLTSAHYWSWIWATCINVLGAQKVHSSSPA